MYLARKIPENGKVNLNFPLSHFSDSESDGEESLTSEGEGSVEDAALSHGEKNFQEIEERREIWRKKIKK